MRDELSGHWGKRVIWVYLIPKDSDGAGGGHFLWTKPHWRDPGRHPQNENLSKRAAELSKEGDREQVWFDAKDFDPRPRTVQSRGHQRDDPKPLLVQQPSDREDEGDVRQHVDHGHPIYSKGVHAVEMHEDVADDAVLYPLERVGERIGAEEKHYEPASLVQAGRRRQGLLTHTVRLFLIPGTLLCVIPCLYFSFLLRILLSVTAIYFTIP